MKRAIIFILMMSIAQAGFAGARGEVIKVRDRITSGTSTSADAVATALKENSPKKDEVVRAFVKGILSSGSSSIAKETGVDVKNVEAILSMAPHSVNALAIMIEAKGAGKLAGSLKTIMSNASRFVELNGGVGSSKASQALNKLMELSITLGDKVEPLISSIAGEMANNRSGNLDAVMEAAVKKAKPGKDISRFIEDLINCKDA